MTRKKAIVPGPGMFLATAPGAGERTIEAATADGRFSPNPPDARIAIEANERIRLKVPGE